jgi:hypothetical protein
MSKVDVPKFLQVAPVKPTSRLLLWGGLVVSVGIPIILLLYVLLQLGTFDIPVQ